MPDPTIINGLTELDDLAQQDALEEDIDLWEAVWELQRDSAIAADDFSPPADEEDPEITDPYRVPHRPIMSDDSDLWDAMDVVEFDDAYWHRHTLG